MGNGTTKYLNQLKTTSTKAIGLRAGHPIAETPGLSVLVPHLAKQTCRKIVVCMDFPTPVHI